MFQGSLQEYPLYGVPIDMTMGMGIILTMNIYISKDNEEFLRKTLPKRSMSGLINELLDRYRAGKGPDILPPEIAEEEEFDPYEDLIL